ncbi:MAG: hypothetical protein AAGB22_06290, partial [Bacteroidota bacterium]
MRIEVSRNLEKDGIEIRFESPPPADVIDLLDDHGFAYMGKERKWWVTYSDARWEVEQTLQARFEPVGGGPGSKIGTPSHEASLANIGKGAFSLLRFTFGDDHPVAEFVLFETAYFEAMSMAVAFGKSHFAMPIEKVEVFPAKYKTQARKALAAAKVITAEALQGKEQRNGWDFLDDRPRTEASPEALTSKNYHLARLEYKAADGKHQLAEFVVLEPTKTQSELFAIAFGTQRYSDRFVKATVVVPKAADRKRAVALLEDGKLVTPATATPSLATPDTNRQDWQSFKTHELLDHLKAEAKKARQGTGRKGRYSDSELYAAFEQWIVRHKPELAERKEQFWKTFLVISREEPDRKPSTIQERNFKKLLKIAPELPEALGAGHTHSKSSFGEDSALMDLSLDVLQEEAPEVYRVALSHYFKQQGDMVPDPDMELRINLEEATVVPLTYQDQFGYQQVYTTSNGE